MRRRRRKWSEGRKWSEEEGGREWSDREIEGVK